MIVIDIETSGVSPVGDGLLSIGAVDILFPEERIYYGECRLQESQQWNQAALDINGFTEASIFDTAKQSEQELLKDFIAWFRKSADRTVAGLHVEGFDVPFLNAVAKRNDIPHEFGKRCVDLHTLAYAKKLQLREEIPVDSDGFSLLKTDEIHTFTGLGPEPRPHNALTGAQYEAESLYRLIYGKGLLSTFADSPVPSYLSF